MNLHLATALALGIQLAVCAAAAGTPQKYELKLVYISERERPEHVFVVGNSGFRSVDSLKRFLGTLPRGAEIVWNPGCERHGKEPLLSSKEQMKAFRDFLESKGLRLTLIPAG